MKEICVAREAFESDFDDIHQLYQSLVSAEDSREDRYGKSWYDFQSGSVFFKSFVVEEEGVIVGSCCISIIPNITKNGKSYAVIENVLIRSNFFGRDVGKALVEASINYAKSCSCYKVMLLNNLHETHVVDLCKSLEFEGDSKAGFVLRFE